MTFDPAIEPMPSLVPQIVELKAALQRSHQNAAEWRVRAGVQTERAEKAEADVVRWRSNFDIQTERAEKAETEYANLKRHCGLLDASRKEALRVRDNAIEGARLWREDYAKERDARLKAEEEVARLRAALEAYTQNHIDRGELARAALAKGGEDG